MASLGKVALQAVAPAVAHTVEAQASTPKAPPAPSSQGVSMGMTAQQRGAFDRRLLAVDDKAVTMGLIDLQNGVASAREYVARSDAAATIAEGLTRQLELALALQVQAAKGVAPTAAAAAGGGAPKVAPRGASGSTGTALAAPPIATMTTPGGKLRSWWGELSPPAKGVTVAAVLGGVYLLFRKRKRRAAR